MPSGALGADVTLAVQQAPTDAPAVPQQLTPRGDTLAITPHGQTFSKPVTIVVPFTGDPTGVVLYTADPNGSWTRVAGAQVVNQTLKADVTHFSFFKPVKERAWVTVFADDFNRPDGGLGSNYVTQIYPSAGSISISNNRVEIAATSATTFSKVLYNTAVTNDPVRVSALFNNVTAEKGEFALAARISPAGTDEVAYMGAVSMSSNSVALSKMTVDSTGALKSNPTLASNAFSPSSNTPYLLTLTLEGGKLELSVATDGGTVATVSATDSAPLTSGKVSVNGNHTANSRLTVDDLKIERLE